MREIPIYKAEYDIRDQILGNTVVAYTCPLMCEHATDEQKQEIIKVFREIAKGNNEEIDLYPLKAILATTTWNKNDDVFDKKETWLARKTPVNKPFNFQHDISKIIGHITGTYAVDSNQEIIPDDIPIDELPALYHIITTSVLYRFVQDKDQAREMASIIEEIEEGKWYVSMEAIIGDFDYAIIEGKNKYRIVERNADTAFLSKYLRKYGGKGVYQGKKIGRLLRSIVFCGKGLVKNPANPDSIIFGESNIFEALDNKLCIDLMSNKEMIMADDNKNELEQAKAKINELELELVSVREANSKTVMAELKTKYETAEASIASLTEKLTNSEKAVAELTKELATAQNELKAAKDELAKMKQEQIKSARVAAFMKVGASETEALDLVNKFEGLNETQFAEIVSAMSVKFGNRYEKPVEQEESKLVDAGELDSAEEVEDEVPHLDSKKDLELARASLVEAFSDVFKLTKKKDKGE